MPATERPRLRTRLALLHAAAVVVLGAVLAVIGLAAWTGQSTHAVGAAAGEGTASNTGAVLVAVVVGLIVVTLVAAPIGWALAGRALRPLRELTSAAEGATADRLPEHGELGRYEEFADLSATLAGLYSRLDAATRHSAASSPTPRRRRPGRCRDAFSGGKGGTRDQQHRSGCAGGRDRPDPEAVPTPHRAPDAERE